MQKIKVLEAQLKQYIASARSGGSGVGTDIVDGEGNSTSLAMVPGMSFEPGENLMEVFVVSGTFVGAGTKGGTSSSLPSSSIVFNGQSITLNGDSTTFVMCDFYDYETQTTPLLLGLNPQYNFSATYKVETDHFFLRFLSTDSLVLEINLARNADFQLIAQCTLPLRDLLTEGGEKTFKEAPMVSVRDGTMIGTLHVQMKLAVPVTELFQLYLKENPSEKARMDKLRLVDRELAEEAAEQARQENNLEIVVVRCEDLRTRTGDSPSAYVGYKLLGYQSVASDIMERSNSPTFDHVQVFPMHISPKVLGSLRRESLELLIFDGNEENRSGSSFDSAPPIGRAVIPLGRLSDGDQIVGAYDLKSPQGDFAGRVHVSLRWRVPLRPDGSYNDRHLPEESVRLLEKQFTADNGLVNTRRFLRYALPRPEVLEAQERLVQIIQKAKRAGNSLKSLFPHFDRNGDHRVDREEFKSGLVDIGITLNPSSLNALFETLDTDGTNEVDFREFRHFVEIPTRTQEEVTRKIRMQFKLLNSTRPNFRNEFQKFTNSNGECTRPEFRMGLVSCGFELVDDPKYLGRLDPRGQDDWGNEETPGEEEVRERGRGEGKNNGSAKSSIRSEYDSLHQQVQDRFENRMENATKASEKAAISEAPGVKYDPPVSAATTSKQKKMNAIYGGYADEQGAAALRLQAAFRGNNVRRGLSGKQRTELSLLEAEDVLLDVIEVLSGANKSMSDLENAFSSLDENGDGFISRLEFKQGLAKCGVKIPPPALDALFAHFDVNGDRRMSHREFMRFASATPMPVSVLLAQLRHNITTVSPKDAFNGLDTDGNGVISPKEFRRGLERMGIIGLDESKIKALTRAFGADESTGNIQLTHFINFCNDAQSNTSTQLNKIQQKLKDIVSTAEKKGLPIETSFQHFDKNGDGEISRKEFKKAMNELSKAVGGRLTPSDLNKLFSKFDKERNGKIQYKAFVEFFKGTVKSDHELQSNFVAPNIDPVNEDHLLRKAQAVTREAARSEHDVSFYFERYDTHPKKGRVTVQQFKRAADAAGFFFSPSELRWLCERFQAEQSNGVSYINFIYWATPEAVQLDVVIQHIRADVSRAEQYGYPIPEVRKEFGLLDKNQTGHVTRAALRRCFQKMHVNLRPQEYEILYKEFENGRDGCDYHELIEKVFHLKPLSSMKKSKSESSSRLSNSMKTSKKPAPPEVEVIAERAMEKLRKLVRLSSKRGGDPKTAFEHFDVHLKGTISRDQFKQGLKSLDITLLEDEMTTIMKMFGDKKRDRLDYGNFLRAVAPNHASTLRMDVDAAISKLKKLVRERARDKNLKDPFIHFDDKKLGWFNARQLQEGLRMLRIQLNEEKTQLVFEAMDMNNDGRVDFNDFTEFFNGRDLDDENDSSSSRKSRSSGGNVFAKIRNAIRDQWRRGKDYRRSFEDEDVSGDGFLSATKFKQALLDLGASLSSDDVRKVIRRFDPSNNGEVNYVSFLREMSPSRRHSTTSDNDSWLVADKLRAMIRQRARLKDGNLRDPFKHFARSKTSFDISDFKVGLSKLSLDLNRRAVEDLFQMIDINRNGKIRFSEFSMFVTGSRYTDAEDKLRALITRMADKWDDGRAMKKAFENFDRNDKGYITASDFRDALRSSGYGDLSKREAEDLVIRFDNNGDDRVSWREFVRFVEDRMRLHSDISDVINRIKKKLMRASRGENPWRIFHEMDRDGNGVLDKLEFGKGLKDLGVNLTSRELDKVMDYFDYNRSGYIGYANFADAVEGRHPGSSSSSYSSSSYNSNNRRRSVSLTRVMDRLTVMVKERARDGRFDYRRPFQHFDVSNRGKISRRDFQDGLKKLDFDLTRSDVDELLEYFDTEGDGKISFEEFCDVIEGRNQGDIVGSSSSSSRTERLYIRMRREIRNHWKNGKDYRIIFEDLDRGRRGILNVSDFKKCMIDLGLSLSREEMNQVLRRFDPLDKGTVDYVEFLREISPSRRSHNNISNTTIKAADRLRNMIRQRCKDMDGNLRDPFRHFAQRRSSFRLRGFEDGLRKLEFKLNLDEIKDLFYLLDIKKNGEIRFSEFSMFVGGTRYTDAEDKLRHAITKMARNWDGGRNMKRAFERIDRDGKGYITARDFEDAIRDCGFGDVTKRDAKELVLRFDENGDDKVSYREFMTFVKDRMRAHEDMSDIILRVKDSLKSRSDRTGDPWVIFHDMDR